MITIKLTAVIYLIVMMCTAHASEELNIEGWIQDVSQTTLENVRDNGGINRATVCEDILSTVYRDPYNVITVNNRVVNGDWKIQTKALRTYKLALLQEIFGCPSKQIQWVKDSACQRFIYGKLYIDSGNHKGPLKDHISTSAINRAIDSIENNSLQRIDYCSHASTDAKTTIRRSLEKEHCKILMKDIYQQPYGYNDHWQNYDINHLVGDDYIAVDWSVIANQNKINQTYDKLEQVRGYCDGGGDESYETYLRWTQQADDLVN
ncbi:MAG TPA: hypothetical protein QF353_05005 [Gammaproteobacteria bacterium]|nr:hypothetical protein [Gammaproteobacteria bacterium]